MDFIEEPKQKILLLIVNMQVGILKKKKNLNGQKNCVYDTYRRLPLSW